MDNENDNENVNNAENKVESVDAFIMERQEIEKMDINDGNNSVRSQEQLNMDKYTEKYEFAHYFPGLEERCINMRRQGIEPLPDINTGALNGDVLYDAGMDLLLAIKKEIFDSKPEWEKECIKEGRIAGARLDDDSFEDDDITPQDGRPRLTVEYLRSIGYDIDIS